MNTPDESKSQERPLTTTSYGVLSILALRDHSTYDLTRQMRMSLHYMWPRAESNVYAEPKRLVAAGLATSREEWTGSRRRTIYAITELGRGGARRVAGRLELAPALRVGGAAQGPVRGERNEGRPAGDDPRDPRGRPRRARTLPAVRRRLRGRRRPVSRSLRPERPRRAPALRAAGGHGTLGELGRRDRVRLGRAVGRRCRLGIETLRASGEGFAIAEDPVSPQT